MIKIKNNFIFKILFFLVLILTYFFTRFQNINAIPVFGDEAIYIRWAQIIKSVETLRFIPLTDGKQPLFMWITALVLKFFSDPLLAGRFVSIMSGFGILISLFLTSTVILNSSSVIKNPLEFLVDSVKKHIDIGLIVCFIYIFLPFSFFFDRLALPDNLLSFFGILSLFFSLLLAKFKRFDLSLLLGFVLGLAWLTKSPAIFFIFLSFVTFIIYNFPKIKSFLLPIISSIISVVIYNILRLGPQFQMISVRNKDYIWSFAEILKHPLDPFKPHLSDIISIYSQYISFLVLILGLIGLIFLIFKKASDFKYQILVIVLLWWLLPLLTNAAIAKVFTARYILFTLPPLILILGLAFNYLFRLNKKFYILLPLVFIFNFIFLFRLSTNPQSLKLPSTETGYLRDWTSGWGIKDSAEYLIKRSLSANVIVGTEGSFGTLPDGLQIYTNNVAHLTVFGVGLGFSQIPEKLVNAKNYGDEVYLLLNKSRNSLIINDQLKLKTIIDTPKPGQDSLVLYQLQ